MDPLYLEALKSSNDLKQPLRKVPGEVVPIGKLSHEVKAFRESILKKNIPELQEVLSRQNLILSNEKLVSKLPDKGAKLKEKVREIEVCKYSYRYIFKTHLSDSGLVTNQIVISSRLYLSLLITTS